MHRSMRVARLAARVTDSLNWDLDQALLEASVMEVPHSFCSGWARDEGVWWEIDCGLHVAPFPLEDRLRFEALSIAMDLFTRDVWESKQSISVGVVIYHGPMDMRSLPLWTETQEQNWREWSRGRSHMEGSIRWKEHLRRLFVLESYISYCQMLAHRLPDTIPICLRFEEEAALSPAFQAHLLCKERMGHCMALVPAKSENPLAKWAICLPEESYCNEEVLDQIDQLYRQLSVEHSRIVRIVSEAFLTEEWEGLDRLYVLVKHLSPRGQRKLAGFVAAGGEVVEILRNREV